MKVLVKEYMLDMLNSVKMAVEQLPTVNEKNNEHLELLGTCQDVLINIAENLPETDEITDKVLIKIDNSCKEMFQLTQLSFLSAEWKSEYENLKLSLGQIVENIEKYEAEKITVMFMPILIENWSSMASIYTAAVQDKRVDAKVMPLPYSEYGYGGTITDNKWDFEFFKEYIPAENLVDCNGYDLGKEHPEMLFINDPYDGDGDEIRIQPKYFSDEIVNKTDHIVYVSPEYNKIIGENIAKASGIKNAWKIIPYDQNEKSDMIQGGVCEEKIINCQSARNDIEMSHKKNELNVLVELKKMNGEDDNSLSIQFMEEILESQNKDDNIQYHWIKNKSFDTEIKRSEKELVEKYEKLIEKIYSGEKNHWAERKEYQELIESSDMYIGQGDSWIFSSFTNTKRPALKRQIGELAKQTIDFKNNPLLGFDKNFVQRGKNIYCYSSKYNGILNLDLDTAVVTLVASDNNFNKSEPNLYGKGCIFANKLSFAPMNSEKVFEKDLLNDKIKYYGEKGVFEKDDYDILGIENFTVLMPQRVKMPIYYINRKSQQINEFDNNYGQAIKDMEYLGNNKLFVAKTQADGILYRSIITNSYIQSYDARNAQFRYGTIGEGKGQIWDLKYDGKFLWCINNDGTTVSLWNRNKNVISKTIDIMDEKCGKQRPCDHMYIEENNRWFLTVDRKTIVHMDKKGQKRIAIDMERPLSIKGNVIGFTKGDSIYFIVDNANMVKIKYINKGGHEELKSENVLASWDKDSLDQFINTDNTFNMTMIGLDEFLKYGTNLKDSYLKSNSTLYDSSIGEKSYGKEIWECLGKEFFTNK